jgi:DNA-binding beta-propeller fold protein YncE
VANYFGHSVTRLRASDGAAAGIFAVGDGPSGIVFDGLNVWVTNNGDDNVMALRRSDGALLATLDVGRSPFGVAVSLLDLVGSALWVANAGADTVSVINL